jgi:hypothetical protein
MSPNIFDRKSICYENPSCSHKYKKVQRSFRKSSPLVPILRQTNSVLYLHYKIHFNSIHKSLSRSTKDCFFRSGFSGEGLYGLCSPSLALRVQPILISPISLPQIGLYLPKAMSYEATLTKISQTSCYCLFLVLNILSNFFVGKHPVPSLGRGIKVKVKT